MQLSTSIDLTKSLQKLFKDSNPDNARIQQDAQRQADTAREILRRFSVSDPCHRREMVLLADEVGLGKTYVALAVAVSMLDAIRKNEQPQDLPSQKPVVLVLTPNSDALFRKWRREAATFKEECTAGDALQWLRIDTPRAELPVGNAMDLTRAIRQSKKGSPLLLIAKLGAFSNALTEADMWRKAALAWFFQHWNVDVEERKFWCRGLFETWSKANVGELLDLRKAGSLWEPLEDYLTNPRNAYDRALRDQPLVQDITKARANGDPGLLRKHLDWVTRMALFWDWPQLPLVIIDEVHNLKNEDTAIP